MFWSSLPMRPIATGPSPSAMRDGLIRSQKYFMRSPRSVARASCVTRRICEPMCSIDTILLYIYTRFVNCCVLKKVMHNALRIHGLTAKECWTRVSTIHKVAVWGRASCKRRWTGSFLMHVAGMTRDQSARQVPQTRLMRL